MECMQLYLEHNKKGMRIIYYKLERSTIIGGEEYFKVEVLLSRGVEMSTSNKDMTLRIGYKTHTTVSAATH